MLKFLIWYRSDEVSIQLCICTYSFHNSILIKFSDDNQITLQNERNNFSHIIDTLIEAYRKTSTILLKRILSKMKYIECSNKSESGDIEKLSVIKKIIQSDMYIDIVSFFSNIHDTLQIFMPMTSYSKIFLFIEKYFKIIFYRFLTNFFTIQISDILIENIYST